MYDCIYTKWTYANICKDMANTGRKKRLVRFFGRSFFQVQEIFRELPVQVFVGAQVMKWSVDPCIHRIFFMQLALEDPGFFLQNSRPANFFGQRLRGRNHRPKPPGREEVTMESIRTSVHTKEHMHLGCRFDGWTTVPTSGKSWRTTWRSPDHNTINWKPWSL